MSAIAAALSAALLVITLPTLKAYAVAHATARSSHREPTPQGGGAAVVLSTFLVVWCAILLGSPVAPDQLARLAVLTVAGALLAVVGAVDDIRGLSPLSRLVTQAIAMGMIVVSIPM